MQTKQATVNKATEHDLTKNTISQEKSPFLSDQTQRANPNPRMEKRRQNKIPKGYDLNK